MTDVTTRAIGPEDSEFAFQTKKAALGPYVAQVWGWDDRVQREQHARRYATQNVEIVECSGQDVGLIATVRNSDELVLNQLFILPPHQGKGIGTACMLRLIDEARTSGIPIRLRVLKVNIRGVAFYENLGFARVGEIDTHVLMERSP